ncbi:MAG: toxin TumE [Anaerolineae bacterium]
MIRRYLSRIHGLIYSRTDARIEMLSLRPISSEEGRLRGRLSFSDGSLLEFREAVAIEEQQVIKLSYAYHYQRADGALVVRYDNAPHHPELPGFPNHKHTPAGIEPAEPPDLSEVLTEIDTYLYPAESR